MVFHVSTFTNSIPRQVNPPSLLQQGLAELKTLDNTFQDLTVYIDKLDQDDGVKFLSVLSRLTPAEILDKLTGLFGAL